MWHTIYIFIIKQDIQVLSHFQRNNNWLLICSKLMLVYLNCKVLINHVPHRSPNIRTSFSLSIIVTTKLFFNIYFIYIYRTECVCVCLCVPLYRIYFLSFFKKIFHLIEKLSGSVLVKTKLKYLIVFEL